MTKGRTTVLNEGAQATGL